MVSKNALAAILALSTGINAGGMGVIGLGRTVYEPLCCYACLSSLWSLQLSCTQGSQLPAENRGSDPFCHATSTVYLESLAYCMQTRCQTDNVSSSVVNQCWSKVAGDGVQVSSLENNLPDSVPTIELAYNAASLDEVSLVNGQYYEDSRVTISSARKQESVHALYGTIDIVVVVGFCLILGLHRLKSHYLPILSLPGSVSATISKYITKPALVGKMHLRRFPGNLGYIPSRGLSLLILCFIALNVVLCAISYPVQTVDTWYISSKKQKIAWAANRLGVLSFANLALTIMFSGRNTPLLWITGASRTDILTFHRWCSRVAAAQGIIHVVLYWTNTSRSGYNMLTLASDIHVVNYVSSYWSYGIIAVAGLGFLVIIFSMLPLRVKFYETFLVIHIVLVIVILFGLWQHVVLRFHKAYGYEVWLYIAFAFWGFDRLIRPTRILALNWKSWIARGFPKATVELLPGEEFVKVTVFPSLTWNFMPGQHCYLYFPTTGGNPFQSHPFSIASWSHNNQILNDEPGFATDDTIVPAEPGQEERGLELKSIPPPRLNQNSTFIPQRPNISFIVRPENGLTQSLHKRLLKNSKLALPKSIPVFIEGPYGAGPPLSIRNADTILAIAGGIGITSIIGYLQLYLDTLCVLNDDTKRRHPGKASRFILVWSVREESLIKAINSQLGDVDVLRMKGVELQIMHTRDDDASARRLDVNEVVRNELLGEEDGGKKVCVVMCGPGGMADSVRSAVVGCIGQKGVDVELVEESFCW